MTLPPGRRAGVGLHLTSLPGRFGIGELGREAYAFIDAMSRMGLSIWQFLPLGPTAFGNSPYQSLSTFAGNELLIDVADLCASGLLTSDEIECLADLPSDRVDYGRLIPLKTQVLERAAERFERLASRVLRDSFEEFVERHDSAWLHDYALFKLLKSKHNERPWPEWEQRYVSHDEKPLRVLAETEAPAIRRQKIIQFFFYHQWQKLRTYAEQSGIRLFGDIPIYLALDSADAWSNKELLRLDGDGTVTHVAGVPPDYFSQDGQLWGNPLYNWDYHAETGFSWWIDRLRAALEAHDLVRLDHFRGFESYWTVSANAESARHGAWEKGPGDAILDALSASLGELPIVAEDLGMITPEVRALRERHQIPGMVVLQFMVDDAGFDTGNIAEDCVCYTGTHDNDTTIGWFLGSLGENRSAEDISKRQDAALTMSGGSAATIHHDLIRTALATNAKIAIAPMQDYLGLGTESRFNIPGTTSDNWQWRVTQDQLSNKLFESVATMVGESGRAEKPER